MFTTERVIADQSETRLLSSGSGELITFTAQNLNTAGQPIVFTTDDPAWGKLLFTATNASSLVVTLTTSSVLAVYLDSLLTDDEIGKITRSSATWSGGPVTDDLGTHLRFSPKESITLLPSQSIQIEVEGVLATGLAITGCFVFAYQGFGVPDSQSQIQGFRQAPPASTIPWPLGLSWAPRDTYQQLGDTVYVTPWSGQDGIKNSFVLQINNAQSSPIPLPAGSTPQIVVSFVGGNTLLSLGRADQIKQINGAITQSDWPWSIDKNQNGPLTIFILTPQPGNLDLFNGGGVLAITFSGLITDLAPEYASPVFVQYAGLNGYADGYSSILINKTTPLPYVTQFEVTSGGVPVAANTTIAFNPVNVSWDVFAAQNCMLRGVSTPFPALGSYTFTPGGPYPAAVDCHLQPQIGSDSYDGAELPFSMEAPPPVQVSINASADNPVPGPHGVWNVSVNWSTVNATSAEVLRLDNGGVIGTGLSGGWGTSGMASVPLNFRIIATGPAGTVQQDCQAQLD